MKQILQYLWIEKYGCIEKQGFNFTRRANIQFDYEAKKLTIEKNKDYCEDFFDDSIDLSCIVGRNGVGKTTILRAIKEIFSKKSETEYLVVLYNGSNYDIYHYLKEYVKSPDNNKYETKIVKSIDIEYDKLTVEKQICNRLYYSLNKPVCLYYTEHLSPAQYTFPAGDNELSTSHKLWNIHSLYSEETGDHINRFFLNEFENQMNLILDYGEKLDIFKIKYPPYVIATLKCDRRIFDGFVKQYESLGFSGTLNDLYRRLFPTNHLVNNDKMIKFKDTMAEAIFLNIIYTLQHTVNGLTNENFKSFLKIIEKYVNLKNGWNFLKSFLHNINGKFTIFRLEEYISFMDYIDQIQVSSNENALLGFIDNNSFIIPTIKDYNNDKVDFFNDIKEFFEKYYLTAEFNSYINFSWGLSSGETSLLNIFSRLYSSECKKETEKEAALFLLDEIDVTLHPEWQRTIINELLKFLKYTFKDKFIQVIMTTHSPIMLSDIPKQNVVYISSNNAREEYKEQPETFGSNIFKLYNNAFFLDNGAIGQLAKEKLEKLLEEILAGNGNENDIQKRINMIGDDFLKKQFQLQFDSTYNKKDIVDEEKEKLKARIKELEEELADFKNQNR